MKFALFIICFIYSSGTLGQALPDSIQNRIKVLLTKHSTGQLNNQEKTEIKSLTYLIQSKGFGLQERSHNYKQSLAYIDSALVIWTELKDTPNIANLRKYRGLLLGYLGNFIQAKVEISKAVELFRFKKMDFGIAVSEFDLSRVYGLQGRLDSGLYFADDAMRFWKAKSDTQRIFVINLQLIDLYYRSNDVKKAEQIQKESALLIENKDVYWLNLIDFYLLSSRIYRKLHENDLAKRYSTLYENEIEKLKKSDHFTARSNYE